MIIPVPLAILQEIHFICSSQFSLLSIIIPKNFAISSSLIMDPFILKEGQISFFPLGLNIIKFVLSILRDNRLAFNHFITLLSSLFITVDNSCKLLALQNNVVSSANKIEGEFTGHRWIPLSKARDAELWCFLWSAPDKRLSKQSWRRWFETPSHSLWCHCNELFFVYYHLGVIS